MAVWWKSERIRLLEFDFVEVSRDGGYGAVLLFEREERAAQYHQNDRYRNIR